VNILNTQPVTNNEGGPPVWGLDMRLTTPHRKNKLVTKFKEPGAWTDSLEKQPKRRNMDMRFGTWNIRSLYKAGSLMTLSGGGGDLARLGLLLVGVQEVRWEGSGTKPVGEYTFSVQSKMKTVNLVHLLLYIRESSACLCLVTSKHIKIQ
jgi:hypothetical protein